GGGEPEGELSAITHHLDRERAMDGAARGESVDRPRDFARRSGAASLAACSARAAAREVRFRDRLPGADQIGADRECGQAGAHLWIRSLADAREGGGAVLLALHGL